MARLDAVPYAPYSLVMNVRSKPNRKGAEAARQQLPAILAAAGAGRTTVITRHGRDVAAVVPVATLKQQRQASLQPLAGSGRALWGRDSAKSIDQLRDEWKR